MVASTKGAHILFRAVQPNTISILVFEEGDTFALLSPSQALNDSPLNGSIYVEELEDLMQITSASDDGLIIEIAKYPLGFLFRNKQTFATGTATSNTVFIEKGDFLSLLIASPGKGVEIVNRTNEGDKNSISANVPGSGTSTSDRSILDLIK
ncbi:MAG TPA: hypothetical protein PLK12_10545 [Prolixibacteraceae bacterium]|nr:hypothetical protein [Prolixibacteraceae bacterium]